MSTTRPKGLTMEANADMRSARGADKSAIVPFAFEGKPVRVIQDAARDPWFVAHDACRILDLANVTMALRGLDDDEKGLSIVETLRGDQELNVISEPGLYRLMGRTRKPAARRPRRRSEEHKQTGGTGDGDQWIDERNQREPPARRLRSGWRGLRQQPGRGGLLREAAR